MWSTKLEVAVFNYILFGACCRIKKEVLPVVQSLCQDVEYEVRGCMCLQLDPVSRGLG